MIKQTTLEQTTSFPTTVEIRPTRRYRHYKTDAERLQAIRKRAIKYYRNYRDLINHRRRLAYANKHESAQAVPQVEVLA
ncbi:MAG TPA: hypothetical protein VGR78_02770 [Verrucomicrobiae bacterium]|nr:hypothetical protein [Verrucomicrobiae bacterium]